MAPKLTLASRPSCRSRMNLSLDLDGRKTWMAELNQPRRELKGKTRGFATGRNSHESSPDSMTRPLGGSCCRYTGGQYRAWDEVPQAGFGMFSPAAARCPLLLNPISRASAVNRGRHLLGLRVANFGLQLAADGRYRILGAGKP